MHLYHTFVWCFISKYHRTIAVAGIEPAKIPRLYLVRLPNSPPLHKQAANSCCGRVSCRLFIFTLLFLQRLVAAPFPTFYTVFKAEPQRICLNQVAIVTVRVLPLVQRTGFEPATPPFSHIAFRQVFFP